MDNKIILCDCDGVLVDYDHSLKVWADFKGYDISIDTSYSYDLATEFNNSASIGYLPPLKDARHYIELLENDGYKIHMITSMGINPISNRLRKLNLEHLYGDNIFIDMTFLELKSRKIEILKKYEGSGLYWIEDNIQNVQDGLDLGLRSILMDSRKNKLDNINCTRVYNWKEIYEIIKNG